EPCGNLGACECGRGSGRHATVETSLPARFFIPVLDRIGHAIVAPTPPAVPLVFPPCIRPRSAIGPAPGMAARRGGSGPGPSDRHELDPGRWAQRRVPPMLHDRLGCRETDRPYGRSPGPRGGQAVGGRYGATDVRTG